MDEESFETAAEAIAVGLTGDLRDALCVAPSLVDLRSSNPEWCLLDYAVEHDDVEAAECLIARGADPQGALPHVGWPPLLSCLEVQVDRRAQSGLAPGTQMLQLLLVAGANPNLGSPEGLLPRAYLSDQGWDEAITLLEQFHSGDDQD